MFDLIIAVMVFNHIGDLNAAFHKVDQLLKKRGELHVVIPDFDYFKMRRHDYQVSSETINDNAYAVAVQRNFGTIADIVRRPEEYHKAAQSANLSLIESIPMFPTDDLIRSKPSYQALKNQAITHLLRYQKSG